MSTAPAALSVTASASVDASSTTTSAGSPPASAGDVFAQIFARLLGPNASLLSPSLTNPVLPTGETPITSVTSTNGSASGPKADGVSTGSEVVSVENIQAFSTAIAQFLASTPQAGLKTTLANKLAEPLVGTAEGIPLETLDILTTLDTSLTNAVPTEVTPKELPAAPLPSLSPSAAVDSTLLAQTVLIPGGNGPAPASPGNSPTEGKGRLQPLQLGFLSAARRVSETNSSVGGVGLAGSNPLDARPSLESLLGGSRSNRIVVDKSVLKAVDKFLNRAPAADLSAERGVSILTPDELKATSASVEDRNATALARVDRGEFVNRVVQALERANIEQPKRIEIELQPPALGKLKVQVIERGGELTARIEVHSPAARTLLVDNLPTLDRHLGEQGVQIQRFQVDQTNTGYSNMQDRGSDPSQQGWGGQDPRQPGRQAFFEPLAEEESASPISLADLLGLADGMDRVI